MACFPAACSISVFPYADLTLSLPATLIFRLVSLLILPDVRGLPRLFLSCPWPKHSGLVVYSCLLLLLWYHLFVVFKLGHYRPAANGYSALIPCSVNYFSRENAALIVCIPQRPLSFATFMCYCELLPPISTTQTFY